ncbi:TPA: TetR/AcrR family transcriptional regulator [Stenotrophomonas maltophilia]|jgi:AcrR family transcriptional regulator|uniref:TetR/AcrR family transcriptional regulator n=1 Tax=Stenotrophomonas TaxID=40323 RepID=UPI000977EB68|nr:MULTISPECIES: TetR/AcrR family transcriptional regulator [Stenotrophomonas]MCV4212846.1 TetR/AcrR family transcriptional regulator [Pseudomonas cichorii]EKV1264333.1 TetR/AcrR family transcriptional regulator [Stenotrophomonas maltophilia]EKV1268246.1 TetR/AcrR family transcriptional regulator [Stenotrophomonas maltophilia]MBA0239127.1 TetR/AcrR family transcriptional regulator [Stenotrophomonas maltophilia]MBA0259809.1 TetR/AcrR family transcriptional regulator [Stenotrophomonas maltophili
MSRADRNEQRIAQILQAALQCFLAKGFHQTSMRDIAQAAGVSLGNLYNHFPGKEAIILAVAVAESEELAPLLQRLAASEGERAQVLAFLRDFHALCRQPEWATLAVEVLAESARNPAVAEAFAANRRQLQAVLAEALQQVAQREHRRPVLAPALQAQVLLDAIESDALRRGLGEAGEGDEASLDLGLLALLLGARA